MRVKKINFAIIISILAMINIVSLFSKSFAVEKICTPSKEKALPGEKININIDVSKIEYQKFKIEISNNLNIGEGKIEGETQVNIQSSTSNTLVLNANNTINYLSINYTMPDQETNVKFVIKIIKLEDKPIISQNVIDNEIINEIIGTETIETDYVEEEIIINVSKNNIEFSPTNNVIGNLIGNVIDNNVNENEDKKDFFDDKEGFEDKDILGAIKDKDGMMKQEKEFASMKEIMKKMEDDLTEANTKISSLQNTVKYQGSQNNYLKELKIVGYDFKNTFKKTTTTYFADVESSVESVSITAKPEDTSAVVTIYGNTSLKTGKNKIIITVTADDGSERVYRIYVTKK